MLQQSVGCGVRQDLVGESSRDGTMTTRKAPAKNSNMVVAVAMRTTLSLRPSVDRPVNQEVNYFPISFDILVVRYG